MSHCGNKKSLHITGSCVEFYKFFEFFSGKTNLFCHPYGHI